MSIREDVPKCAGARAERYNKKQWGQTSIMLCVILLNALAFSFGCRPSRQTPPQASSDSIVAEDLRALNEYTRSGTKKGSDLLRPLAPSRIALWSQAAKNGNPDGQYLLGYCYIHGMGVESNKSESIKWFQAAANQNQPNAQLVMAYRYAQGKEITKDISEALRLATAAATAGNPQAQYALGQSYSSGDIVTKNPAEGVKWFQKAADQGHAAAQRRLGYCYEASLGGLPKSSTEAVRWYRSASDLGDASAQFILGMCYFGGETLPKDLAQAAQWFQKAADQGDKDAIVMMGDSYRNGWGVGVSISEAAKWYRKAADSGNAEAQRNLGDCYSYTDSPLLPSAPQSDFPQNYSEAFYWYNKAAVNGDLDAHERVGNCYLFGKGVAEDHKTAFKWYMIAVNKNHSDSMYAISGYYMLKDPLYAYAWGQLAALKSGHKNEEGYFEKVLSPEEMREAEAWAKSWQPGTTEETILTTTALSDPVTPVRRMNRAMAAGYYDTVRACVLEDQHRMLQVLEQSRDDFLNLRYSFKEYNREVSGSTAKIMHNTPTGKSYITVVVRTGDRWKVDFKQTILENN